jgi:hypothetical protein
MVIDCDMVHEMERVLKPQHDGSFSSKAMAEDTPITDFPEGIVHKQTGKR